MGPGRRRSRPHPPRSDQQRRLRRVPELPPPPRAPAPLSRHQAGEIRTRRLSGYLTSEELHPFSFEAAQPSCWPQMLPPARPFLPGRGRRGRRGADRPRVRGGLRRPGAAARHLARELDHRDLNEVLDIEPTSENLARHLYGWCRDNIRCPGPPASRRSGSARPHRPGRSTAREGCHDPRGGPGGVGSWDWCAAAASEASRPILARPWPVPPPGGHDGRRRGHHGLRACPRLRRRRPIATPAGRAVRRQPRQSRRPG